VEADRVDRARVAAVLLNTEPARLKAATRATIVVVKRVAGRLRRRGQLRGQLGAGWCGGRVRVEVPEAGGGVGGGCAYEEVVVGGEGGEVAGGEEVAGDGQAADVPDAAAEEACLAGLSTSLLCTMFATTELSREGVAALGCELDFSSFWCLTGD